MKNTMNKKSTIIFFDIDNSIVRGYTQKYFIHYLFNRRIINFNILFLAYFWFLLYKLNISKDVEGAMNFYLKFLKNWSENDLENFIDSFFDKYLKNKIFPGAINLIESHKSMGHEIVLISTSIEPIVKRVAKFLMLEQYISTKLDMEKHRYTGRINGLAVTGEQKKVLAEEYILSFRKDVSEDLDIYFYSDHISDGPLLNFVNHPCVINPNKKLYNIAINKKWKIINY